MHAGPQAIALDHVPGHIGVVLLGKEVQLGRAQAAVAAVVDVEHALDRHRRLLALLLMALLLPLRRSLLGRGLPFGSRRAVGGRRG